MVTNRPTAPPAPTDQAAERPLSPYYEHPACGFHWHGRDGMDIPLRDGQPLCPRCELRRMEDAITRVLALADRLDDIARETAGPEAVHPVAAHIRHQLDTTADVAQQAEPVGENPTEADVDRMLAEGVPVQIVTGAPSTFTTQPPAADADQAANARLASGLRALMAHDAAEEQPT